ncbi:alpha/beta fold hydrolase [Qaidamihabitans albus]|uniref:alpha/beta fold hydrolase n=1 Tax=Qaidamihabitans albus TaxID=2795733 RepID=UPI0018F25DAF|nr:alpha/beta hydrolase [Qaidamihabitans albus]
MTTTQFDETAVRHDYADVNGTRLHYVSAGAGPLIMFLHGFPQCWYQYREQLAEFSRDHHAVAPDLRGCNLSAKPEDVHAYTTCTMVEDIRRLALDLGHQRFVLVGHDVGGAVAWSFALHHPDMLRALVILDAPHPALFDHALHHDSDQQEASRYMLTARRPDAVEFFSANDFAVLRAALDEPFIQPGTLARYVEGWQEPGALAAALRWFHAEGQGPESPDGTPANGNVVRHISPLTVTVPTLVMHAGDDRWIRPASRRGLDRYVTDLTFIDVPGGTHWITDEHPGLVNRTIRDHLGNGA